MSTNDLDPLLADLDTLATVDGQVGASPRTRARVMARWDEHVRTPVRSLRWWSLLGPATACAAIAWLAIALGALNPSHRPQSLGVVEDVDGSLVRVDSGRTEAMTAGRPLRQDTVLRTGEEAGAQLLLADGSRVEMRSRSALSLNRALDGVRINLRTGGVIVHAAPQRSGHLFVQTKDMTVSVVGTVFLVNAVDAGSQVAVIEGTVRVQRASETRTLRPGQQVTTNAMLEAIPVRDAIAWSRRAEALAHLLQAASQTAPTVAGSEPPPVQFEVLGGSPRFEVVSIRPCGPLDGNRGGPVSVSPGRMTATCQTVMGFIEAAYRLFAEGRSNPRSAVRIVGGPDWIRSTRYTITATTPHGATPALMQGPMLQALLEDRFQVKVHRDVREIPIYELTVAGGGHKLRPFEPGSCTSVLPVESGRPRPLGPGEVPCSGRVRKNGPHLALEARRTTLDELAWFIGLMMDRPVRDRTATLGTFDAFVEFTPDQSTPLAPPTLSGEAEPTAPGIFTAIEEQLGLKLEATRGPGEFIVIDRVERPTEN